MKDIKSVRTAGLLVFVLAAVIATPVLGRDAVLPPSAPKGTVCGFSGKAVFLEQTDVTEGLCVDATVSKAQLNQPVTIRFFIHQKPGDFPVTGLQLNHEKYLHVIGVRDDLNEFFHIHPVQVGPGLWEVKHVFKHAGTYKLWSEIVCGDVLYSFGHPLVTVPGAFEALDTDREPRDRAVVSGFQVTFKHSEPLVAGRASSLEFLIRDLSGKEIKTEDFLGAPMHIVIVKDDLSVCMHSHPDVQNTTSPVISFTQVFAKPGSYRLFAQFRPKGSPLPADQAIVAPFYMRVINSPESDSNLISVKN